MLTGPITAMSQPRRKNGNEFHELYENRRAVRAAFASDRAHLATYTVCDRRKFVEFVKFVAECFRRQFFPEPSPEAEALLLRCKDAKTGTASPGT